MDQAITTTAKRLGRKCLIVTFAAATLMLSSLAPQASALSSSVGGSPGTVSFDRIVGYNTFQQMWSGSSWVTINTPALTHQTFRICRSNRSWGAQKVIAVYDVMRWNGSTWYLQQQKHFEDVIPAGASCIDQPFRTTQGTQLGAWQDGGHFWVRVIFGWVDAHDNLLGHRGYVFETGDYTCTPNMPKPCTVGSGWIYLGR